MADDAGQIAAVVEMGVGHDHGVDVRGVARQRSPVAATQVSEPLEQSAVDQDARVVALDEELAPRDGAHAAEEAQERRPGRPEAVRTGAARHGVLQGAASSR